MKLDFTEGIKTQDLFRSCKTAERFHYYLEWKHLEPAGFPAHFPAWLCA